jgi:dCTP deaminase
VTTHQKTNQQLVFPYGRDQLIKNSRDLDQARGDGATMVDCPRTMGPVTHSATAELLRKSGWKPMISPFSPELVRYHGKTRIISWGLSSYGYDIRISGVDLKLFNNIGGQIVDPMRIQTGRYAVPEVMHDDEFDLDYFILPPNSLVLAHTVESFCIPRDILVTCIGKSTYARVGVHQLVTPLEPEWEGELVLEIASTTNYHTRVYIGCGIAQLMFNKADEICEVSYKDRDGKYQGQTGTQDALV